MNTFAPNFLEGFHQGKKNNDPMDFTATKVFFKEKKIILNDFIKENERAVIGCFHKEY